MKTLASFFAVAALLLTCKPAEIVQIDVTPTVANVPDPTFIQRKGAQLVLNNQPISLQGVAFGNWVWDNATTPNPKHHNEADYARLKSMGLNAIRFYLSYTYFEDDNRPYTYKQAGWDWLDTNIGWAKKHGIYLILNVHVPQGGYQSQGKGGALWDVPENQNRFVAWWKAIANRYKNEPIIAGYDLLNEPVTTQSIEQWKTLAERLVKTIRQVDNRHLIVVERLNAIAGNWKDYNGERNLFLVQDPNVMYQFHTYDPFEYTHQTFNWANRPADEFETYPDPSRISVPGDAAWYTGTFDNPTLPAGTSAWTYFEGVKYKVTDPKIKIGMAVCAAAKVGSGGAASGRVFFDDLVIKEYDETGKFVRDVLTLPMEKQDGWYFWSSNNSGTLSVADGGRTGRAFSVSGTTDDANTGFYQSRFIPKAGYSYQVNGWMRGDNVPTSASVRLRVDFETTNQPVLARNKEYLRQALQFYADWGKKNDVPMYLGEYGAGTPCFRDGRGGLRWTEDMIDLNKEFGFHTTYHAYHESSFGWFYSNDALPDPANANTELLTLFKQKFGK
jgi:endoglucanase